MDNCGGSLSWFLLTVSFTICYTAICPTSLSLHLQPSCHTLNQNLESVQKVPLPKEHTPGCSYPKKHLFIPSMQDSFFDIWAGKGLISLSDLYINGTFASFEQLVQRYDIPKSHFYRYLQLRNFVALNSDCFPTSPPTSLLDTVFTLKSVTKRAIGSIYDLINTYNPTPLNLIKMKWETDFDEVIPEETWQKIIKNIFSSSICLRHAVIQFKVVYRLHWSRTRLAKINADIDPICVRCSLAPATLLHMFWTCPRLHSFWQNIFGTFSKMCGKTVEPSPYIALFGVAPMDSPFLLRKETTMMAFCSLLARRLILLTWKDSVPPLFNHWIREVMCHLRLEKIRYTIRGSTGTFYNIWQPFLSFVEDMDAENTM